MVFNGTSTKKCPIMGPRSAATQAASLCTYIRAWLIQVSGYVGLTHKHRHRPRIRPLVDRRRNTDTVLVPAGICEQYRRKKSYRYTLNAYYHTSHNKNVTKFTKKTSSHKQTHLYQLSNRIQERKSTTKSLSKPSTMQKSKAINWVTCSHAFIETIPKNYSKQKWQ